MEAKNLRYIVFLINDSRHKYLNGKYVDAQSGAVLCNPIDAFEYAKSAINDRECNRFVIGQFYMDKDVEEMSISLIETFGFRHDKASINQLNLLTALT